MQRASCSTPLGNENQTFTLWYNAGGSKRSSEAQCSRCQVANPVHSASGIKSWLYSTASENQAIYRAYVTSMTG